MPKGIYAKNQEHDFYSRLLDKISIEGDCWVWTGARVTNGYGLSYDGEHNIMAHKLSYILFVGDIPKDYEVDHLCKNRACINPDHLEAVTHYENTMRSTNIVAINKQKTHCIHGHEFTEENIYHPPKFPNSRYCKMCLRLRYSKCNKLDKV